MYFTIFVFIYVLLLIVFMIVIVVKRKIHRQSLKRKNLEYSKYLLTKITDYKSILTEIRSKFELDKNEKKNTFRKRIWKKYRPLYDFNVIKTGKIYYGCLIQANVALLHLNTYISPIVLPGVIIYSTDEYFEENPLDLIPIANNLFANKPNNILSYESVFFSNIKVSEKSEKEIYMTTIMFCNEHLPTARLAGRIFPIIADPQNSTSSFVIDDKYWTKDLIANYINNSFK